MTYNQVIYCRHQRKIKEESKQERKSRYDAVNFALCVPIEANKEFAGMMLR